MAFSDGDSTSTAAGAVVRGDRVVDGFAFARGTVGGLDATDAVLELVDTVDRPDVTALLLAGVAPAWFNLLKLPAIHEATALPTLAVSFEASAGLEPAIREQFDGDARRRRLAAYRALPPRRSLTVNGEELFVRAVGVDAPAAGDTGGERRDRDERGGDVDGDTAPAPRLAPNCEAARLVRGFTPEGGRPEPLRVARLAARAGRSFAEQVGDAGAATSERRS